MKRKERIKIRQISTWRGNGKPASPTLLFVLLVFFAVLFIATVGVFSEYGIGLPLLAISSVGIAVWIICKKRFNKYGIASEGYCYYCGYDLTGNVTGVCSECRAEVRCDSIEKIDDQHV